MFWFFTWANSVELLLSKFFPDIFPTNIDYMSRIQCLFLVFKCIMLLKLVFALKNTFIIIISHTFRKFEIFSWGSFLFIKLDFVEAHVFKTHLVNVSSVYHTHFVECLACVLFTMSTLLVCTRSAMSSHQSFHVLEPSQKRDAMGCKGRIMEMDIERLRTNKVFLKAFLI